MPLTISSPLHILHLSAPETPCPELLKDTETHQISTPYYEASVPIWRDALPVTTATLSTWKAEWITLEAREVIRAIGAWVVSIQKPRTKDDLRTIREVLFMISEVVEHHRSESYDVGEPLLLAVGMPQLLAPSLEIGIDEWEDLGRECGGWEWIDGEIGDFEGRKEKMNKILPGEGEHEADGHNNHDLSNRNELGEKVGMARLKEALEANEWEAGDADDFEGLDDLGFDDDDASLGFEEEAEEAQLEMWGLRRALGKEGGLEGEEMYKDGEAAGNEGDDQEVQELESMMLKLQAVRDMGTDMPEGERKKFAAKAVRDVMKKK